MADQNYEYFKKSFDELCKHYAGKFIAIKDCKVIGAYDSFDEAARTTAKTEELGSFLVQHCDKDSPMYANVYCNRNVKFGGALCL